MAVKMFSDKKVICIEFEKHSLVSSGMNVNRL